MTDPNKTNLVPAHKGDVRIVSQDLVRRGLDHPKIDEKTTSQYLARRGLEHPTYWITTLDDPDTRIELLSNKIDERTKMEIRTLSAYLNRICRLRGEQIGTWDGEKPDYTEPVYAFFDLLRSFENWIIPDFHMVLDQVIKKEVHELLINEMKVRLTYIWASESSGGTPGLWFNLIQSGYFLKILIRLQMFIAE